MLITKFDDILFYVCDNLGYILMEIIKNSISNNDEE